MLTVHRPAAKFSFKTANAVIFGLKLTSNMVLYADLKLGVSLTQRN